MPDAPRACPFRNGLDEIEYTWEYSAIVVDFREHGVAGIRCVAAPCATFRGVGVGSDLQTLIAAYGPHLFFFSNDSTRVAGFDPPDGCTITFRLRAQRVARIELMCEI